MIELGLFAVALLACCLMIRRATRRIEARVEARDAAVQKQAKALNRNAAHTLSAAQALVDAGQLRAEQLYDDAQNMHRRVDRFVSDQKPGA